MPLHLGRLAAEGVKKLNIAEQARGSSLQCALRILGPKLTPTPGSAALPLFPIVLFGRGLLDATPLLQMSGFSSAAARHLCHNLTSTPRGPPDPISPFQAEKKTRFHDPAASGTLGRDGYLIETSAGVRGFLFPAGTGLFHPLQAERRRARERRRVWGRRHRVGHTLRYPLPPPTVSAVALAVAASAETLTLPLEGFGVGFLRLMHLLFWSMSAREDEIPRKPLPFGYRSSFTLVHGLSRAFTVESGRAKF
jgi:hypothetical protein